MKFKEVNKIFKPIRKKYYLGKILEHPEIMTQGETLEELIENIKDAYYLMIFV